MTPDQSHPEASWPEIGAPENGALETGALELHGRVMPASNATFVGEIDGVRVVYKPIAGERPLWDFPDGTLAGREVAAYRISEHLGWSVVPLTWLRDGPHGLGMVQVWKEPDEREAAVDIVPAGKIPAGWCRVFDGLDSRDHEVSLIHEDSAALRRMAVFDVVVNNADRKGGHVLPMAGGHRYGVDHGVTMHVDPKLRTVLWGWAGTSLAADEIAAVSGLLEKEGQVRASLEDLVTTSEVDALLLRAAELAESGEFPSPNGSWPAIPWPPW